MQNQQRKRIFGYDFNQKFDYSDLIKNYENIGLQSTNLHKCIEIIQQMREERKKNQNVKIILGYTSNIISSGLREIIRFLCEHKLVDVVCTTCGGIEEDIMKCFHHSYLSDFIVDDKKLRKNLVNRIGNMIVSNDSYCTFEDFFQQVVVDMDKKQREENYNWTPSKVIRELGKKVNNEESVYYWCYKNEIPVFCPGITDGALGDQFFCSSFKQENFRLDITEDIFLFNDIVVNADKTGAVILGAGLVKYQIMTANAFRGGLDYTVLINNGLEFDGSDSGAKYEKEIVWNKVKKEGEYVKLNAEVSLVFPLIIAETFAKNQIKVQRYIF